MPAKSKRDSHIIKSLDPSALSRYTKDGLYAGRFPTSFLNASSTLNPNPSTPYGTGQSSGLRDPYNNTAKNRFEDTFRADSTAQRALLMLVKFVLGKQPEAVLDSRKQFAAEDLRKQAIESIMSNQEYQNLIATIKQVDVDVHFQEKMMAAQTQKYTFGRSALAIYQDGGNEGLPSDLKILSSKNLGYVNIEQKTWRLVSVDYYDSMVKAQTLEAEELLYFTNLDYNITPDTLFYGQSLIEGIAHASETKRIILEEDLKETAKGMWAPKYILPVPGITSQAKMNELVNGLDPAKVNAVNADIGQPIVFPSSDSIDKLLAAIDQIDRYIIRGIGVPITTMPGYEDITNRATIQLVMQAFKESTLEFERSVLQSQVDAQWYDSLVRIITGQDPLELDYKVRMEFKDLVFDTVADKATVLKMISDMGVPMSDEDKLKYLGMDDLAAKVESVKEDMAKEQADQMKQQQEILAKNPQALQQQQQDGGFPPNANSQNQQE